MSPCIFLFDVSGKMADPWADAGHPCLIIDLQHPAGISRLRDNIWRMGADLRNGVPELPAEWANPCFVAAFPPCDHLAVSGARWFKGKGLRLLSLSVDLFATAAEFCEASGAPYLIENPVSTISTYWRKPDASFNPCDYTAFELGDNYTKRTCLWIGGGLVMPAPAKADGLGEPDDRIHKAPPGPDRHNFRSATPAGFARAIYEANKPERRAA
jgi:hypothetical protein